jgi:hypothetical protein
VCSPSGARETGSVVGTWGHFRTSPAASWIAELPGHLITTVSAFNNVKFGTKELYLYRYHGEYCVLLESFVIVVTDMATVSPSNTSNHLTTQQQYHLAVHPTNLQSNNNIT